MDAFQRKKTQQVSAIISHAWTIYNLPALALALQIIYYTGVRQLEVAPHMAASFDPMCHATRGDVRVEDGELVFTQTWSKTMQRFDQYCTFIIPLSPDTPLCAVSTYRRTIMDTPTSHHDQPLGRLGLNPLNYSLHSLRSSAAMSSYQQNCDHLQVIQVIAGHRRHTYTRDTAANQVTTTLVNTLYKARSQKLLQ